MSSAIISSELLVTKQFSARRNHFGLLAQNSGNARWLSSAPTKDGAKRPQGQTGDCQMRTISLILAFAFVVAGSSMAGSAENGLPGVGTFSYNGSPVVASHSIVVAAR
jgi:hypothetical protein